MNMKQNIKHSILRFGVVALTVALVAGVSSCKKNNVKNPNSEETVDDSCLVDTTMVVAETEEQVKTVKMTDVYLENNFRKSFCIVDNEKVKINDLERFLSAKFKNKNQNVSNEIILHVSENQKMKYVFAVKQAVANTKMFDAINFNASQVDSSLDPDKRISLVSEVTAPNGITEESSATAATEEPELKPYEVEILDDGFIRIGSENVSKTDLKSYIKNQLKYNRYGVFHFHIRNEDTVDDYLIVRSLITKACKEFLNEESISKFNMPIDSLDKDKKAEIRNGFKFGLEEMMED